MNKTRQQELTRWLKQQSIISRRWLMISRLLGVASGLLIVAQAWFLARILHRMVMENIPATALLLPLTLLVLIFVLRGSAFRPGSIFAMKFAARFLTASSRQARRGSRANRPAAGQRLFLSKSTTCTTIMPATCPR